MSSIAFAQPGAIVPRVWQGTGAEAVQAGQTAQVPPATLAREATIDTESGLIKLDVVVTGKEGKPVSGLTQQDFTVLDNGKPVKTLTFEAHDRSAGEAEGPVEVVLIIDTLNLEDEGDMGIWVEHHAEEFLREHGGHLAQPVMLYRVDHDGLWTSTTPTTDGNLLADEVAHKKKLKPVWQFEFVRYPPVGLPNQDYVRNWLSLNALGAIVAEGRRRPGRKLLLWCSYGWPAAGPGIITFEWVVELSTRMREARAALFSITMLPYPKAEAALGEMAAHEKPIQPVTLYQKVSPGRLALEVLAPESGGRAIDETTHMKKEIESCIKEESTFYTLTFDPLRAERPDEFHDLKVEVDRPNLETRTNTGYYDQPVFYDQPRVAAEKVTVKELEQLLKTAQDISEGDIARQLAEMELSERLSSAKLSAWRERLRGEKSRQALTALADASAFLAPPAAEIPATAAPEVSEQKLMLRKTIEYLTNTIPRLPNFFATETIVRYEEPKQKDEQTWKTAPTDQRLHAAVESSATVYYRNGQETMDPGKEKKKKARDRDNGRNMTAKGIFGPVLTSVLVGAMSPKSKLAWSRWEQGPDGPLAVFKYVVPKETPLYEVTYCCLPEGDGKSIFRRMTGYHGEFAIDPESGAIRRLAVQADLESKLPMIRSELMVEYSPVEIGGKVYICPAKSVSISRERTTRRLHEWGANFGIYGPFETMLNDTVFGAYHLFRSESRMVIPDEPARAKP